MSPPAWRRYADIKFLQVLAPGGLVPRTCPVLSISAEAKARAMQETTWADGLRGIAAVFVVCSHLVLCYAREIVPPCCAKNSTQPLLFQWPVLRLVASGQSWVAIFLILSGVVNALKPLKLARAGQTELALSKLGASSSARVCRLVLPATTVTLISWSICQMGLYERAAMNDAFWLRTTSPEMSEGWCASLKDLVTALRDTWTMGVLNPYDQPQWALVFFMQGSFMIISALVLVCSMTPAWRIATLCVLAIWSLDWSRRLGDPFVGFCCFLGVILAEFCLSDLATSMSHLSPILTPPLVLIALFFMSYPTSHFGAAPWSRWLHDLGARYLFADSAGNFDRTYGSLGGLLLVIAIIISPDARWILSRRPLLWLGRVSFAIYLLHGMFLRTIFAWVLSLGRTTAAFTDTLDDGSEYVEDRYPIPSRFRCGLATVCLAACVLVASHLWNQKMEPLFARITTKVEYIVRAKYYEARYLEKTILPIRKG